MTQPLSGSTGTLRPLLRLAWPVLVEQFQLMLVGLVDQWLAGHYLSEPRHLAAIGLISYVLWFLPVLFGAVAIGATAIVARCIGAGKRKDAVHVANQAFLAGAFIALIATALVFLLGGWFVDLVRLREDAGALTERYLQILLPVIPAIMVQQVGIACLRGAGDTFSGFLIMSVVNVVNVAVSASLVIGWGPFPSLGWDGLAIGTACGYALSGTIVLVLFVVGRAGLRLNWRLLAPSLSLIRRLLRVGIPGGIDMLSVVLCHFWFLSIINSLGNVEAAAHGLAVRIESLAYLPGTAFQVAAATLVGQFLGAGDPRRAGRSAAMAGLVGGGLMIGAGLAFFFAGKLLTNAFLGSGTDEVAQLTVPLLRLVAFAMPSLALTMILTGALRGAGDTRWPLMFTFIGFLLIRIPGAYALALDEFSVFGLFTLSGAGLGVMGAWYAMLVDLFLRSFLVLWRFRHGGWKRTVV